ncbi:ABC transporter permease [Mucilaginibacter phyllosphaerae]|uniref:ABC transport system permease protein n=1 Tax=Mucilaginibacter phyllosphaerae TaxID=1812349 RepID=A0A4Y8A8R1_9SPHI|nr:ABC transporter permease [Mucilaginibacter phyllosphaerae]MBB3970874.1 putative ABC transport system permease protein [Mucilaginibacter phyllosphaerae]TEW64191.1 ABC transporter permease [Mucilaginibacter phyllosphaerae]GGH05146.1 ABC transporter permease [Mucilaginibacter phyllosphaerae]
MIRNYFKIAWRNLQKHKAFSFINIFGLAMGIAAFWLITLYVTDEWSYDRYNTKADRIFRVAQHGRWNGGKFDIAVTSPPYAPTLKAEFPQVTDAVRIDAEGGGKITYQDKTISEGSIMLTDNSIFNIFSYQFLHGDANYALAKPQSIVLTKTFAENIFGDAANAINKTIQIEGQPTTVTGVITDVPVNSHFTFKALRSFPADYTAGYGGNWGNSSLYTYLLLKNPGDHKIIEAAGESFFNKHIKNDLGPMKFTMQLQPLTDIHLRSNLSYEIGSNGNITYVYIFSITALLILVIAIINYVNLTTARSSIRIKEIGVRKVIGSGRAQLMAMFFAECILLTFIATISAAVIIQLVLPYFNQLSGKSLVLMQFGTFKTIAAFAAFSLIAGGLSGIYPALFLSGFKTIPAMKGQLGNQFSTILFRKSLVVFQFVITIVMIAGSVIIYQQLNYFQKRDLGFNKAQTLTFHINNRQVRGKVDALKQQLLLNPAIESVGVAGNPIGNNNIGGGDFNLGPDGKPTSESKIVQNLQIDEDFVPTLQIKMAAGRNFSKQVTSDVTNAILVNQTLVKELGWKDAVGKTVRTGVNEQGKVIAQTIVGVVKDFNTYSLQHKIAPMVMQLPAEAKDKDNLYIRIRKGNIQASLDYISKVYSTFDIEDKAEFHFLDQNFAAQYQTEKKQGTILLIFTILAISIACLGLFGLVTFTAEQRIKEIGIRKVLGASITSIVSLLSTDLMKLVAIAVLIASPVAWFAMDKWLQDFAYKISINWWVFLLAGGGAALIALATVSFQSVKAALTDPVKSLRSE